LADVATLTAITEIDHTGDEASATVEVLVNGKPGQTMETTLKPGKNTIQVPFEIENPQLWWPNGMGDQPLYDVSVKVISEGIVDQKARQIGLRTIELIREPDAIGASFYFKVNGHPVFMKGANYIPQDVFLDRPGKAEYQHILSSAKEANMNMIRVWGGGIYENDEFYKLCDEMGLLVWQDFMFACSMFPGDEAFLNNVKQEAVDNVIRLRNHPSIALWCGNNENLSAWENWGWKKTVIEEQGQAVADTLWKAYDDVFHQILPEVVSQYDSSRTYWPSSPGSDFGKTENLTHGDAHYWMVWWGKLPFDNYKTAIPRFMSEYGFQSFPAMSTVAKYTAPEDHDVYSEVMKSHQRSSIGNVTIEEYMQRHYKVPEDFESFLYVSQLLQSHGIKIGIEAHRTNRDRCMGSLYWQVNDCWPVASWSGIDYYGKWKAMHYMAREAFKTFMIGFDQKDDTVSISIVSDSLKSIDAQMDLQLLSFDGTVIENWEQPINIPANQASLQLTKPLHELLTGRDPSSMLLVCKLKLKNQVIASNIHYFLPFKELNLPKPDLSYEVSADKNGFAVTLETDVLAKNVYLSTGTSQNFSDNYFDLLPGEAKTVTINRGDFADISTFEKALKVMTLVDTYTKDSAVQ
ncbi:MAG: glycoside hydrolase family 2 protein, partial [Bacteroidota bacterium]